MMHADMQRPGKDAVLLSTAQLWATRGTCPRLHVGAVIAHDSRIVATGYNGAPAGLPHCTHYPIVKPNSRLYEPCMTAVHAEANAIAFAAKSGTAIDGATLYCTHSPCNTCALLIINSGVARVVYGELFRDDRPLELLKQAKVKVDGIGLS